MAPLASFSDLGCSDECSFGQTALGSSLESRGDAWVWQPLGSLVPEDFETLCLQTYRRLGEALHPGPPFHISFGNPTGLRGKEHLLYNGARGIQNLAETHLAQPGLRASCQLLRTWSQQDQRRLRLLPAPAVPLRARSATTGIWAGVWQSSDTSCSRLNLQRPQQEQMLGRAQAATFRRHAMDILGVVLYSWVPGPKARSANRTTLRFVTEEIILGCSGLRYVTGDFNGPETEYPEIQTWLLEGDSTTAL